MQLRQRKFMLMAHFSFNLEGQRPGIFFCSSPLTFPRPETESAQWGSEDLAWQPPLLEARPCQRTHVDGLGRAVL